MFNFITVLSTILLCVLNHGQRITSDELMDVSWLPEQTRPLSYVLQFAPNLDNWTFTGVANITIIVEMSNTQTVTLNLKDLNVTRVSAMDITNLNSNNQELVTKFNYLTKKEQMEICLKKPIPKDKKVLLSITYEAHIRDDFTGLYKDWYDNKELDKMIMTNFEPTYARRAFPCYDEPMYKAKFSISVVMPVGLTALSNMPILSNPQDNMIVYFRETPPMSTYLVAIYVGKCKPFKNDIADHTINDLPTKINILEMTDFMALGNRTIDNRRQLWSKTVKTSFRIQSFKVEVHKLISQWFGNLQVTCKRWDYLWLNKGFAKYFQYFDRDVRVRYNVSSDWMEELFIVDEFQTALAYDQIPRHPITTDVKTAKDILSVFDIISSSKAASFLRMLKNLMTEELFLKSVQCYLKKTNQNVAEPLDLFSSFYTELHDNKYDIGKGLMVNDFMSNWTLQSGYPVLNITRDETTNTFLVTQSQFNINKINGIINETAAWHIGLTFTTDKSNNFSEVKPAVWTNKESKSTVITAPRDIKWYIFNIQSIGFYRVNYEVENWMALIKQLYDTPNDIHVLNRAQLIDDAFNLARSGQLDYSVPLHLSKYLNKENNTTPWYSAMNGFSYLLERMPRCEEGYEEFKSYVRSLAGTIYNKIDNLVWSGITESKVMSAWETFSKWACRLEYKNCTDKALSYFENFNIKEHTLPADIKDVVFCVGVQKNSHSPLIFEKLFKLYKESESISERMSLEFAFGCSTNRTQLSIILNYIVLEVPKGSINENSMKSVVSAISATPLGLEVLYEFLSTKINKTLDQLSNGEEIVTFIYSTLASKMTKNSDIEKIRDLKDNSTLRESIRTLLKKSVEHNLAWFDGHCDGIKKWTLEFGDKENKAEITTTTTTTIASTTTSKTSSATSNAYNSFVVLQLTVSAVLIKTYIL